ncbi:MAG TPA: hypothetical protein VE196_13890 [Pseudonocardiaceae bacterium]|nr:hypothetical protein [Pseudonocardiaceae bacterium]
MTTAINKSHRIRSGHPPGAAPVAVARWAGIGLGLALSADGVILALLAVITAPPRFLQLAQIALSLAVAIPGLRITQVALADRRPLATGVLLPEIVLAAAMVYFATALSLFHAGHTAYPSAVSQFLTALAALGLGAAGLVLAGATTPSAQYAGQVSFPIAVRDGVILIVGTILVAIAIGQLTGPKLAPPHWNWISFAGITVPGMLILVTREMVKQAYRRSQQPQRSQLARLIVTESLLIGGLFVMFYGSITNLTLGKNGYTMGFAGNNAGIVLLVGAAVFLFAVRGMIKISAASLSGRSLIPRMLVTNLALTAGAIAFFYGERSVIVGHAPSLSVGAAFPAALMIAAIGLLILIPGRVLNRTNAATAA